LSLAFLVRVIVGCEEIAAVFMDIVGVDLGGEVAGIVEKFGVSGAFIKIYCCACHIRMIVQGCWMACFASAPAVQDPLICGNVCLNEFIGGCAMVSQSRRLRVWLAKASAAMINPFQPAKTLLFFAGLMRLSR